MTTIDTHTSHGHRQDHRELGEHVAHLRLAARELPDLSLEERLALGNGDIEIAGDDLRHEAGHIDAVRVYPSIDFLARLGGEK